MEAKQPHQLTPKGRATRQRILTIAATRMFKNGVAGTTTDDLQRAGGISPSQIYHYFGDKKSLVKAVIALQTEAVLKEQNPSLSRLDSFEALEAWRDALIGLQESRHCAGGCPLGSLASELADHDPEARTDLASGFARWEAAIRDGLTALRDRGELTPGADPDSLALAMLTAVQGGLLMTQVRHDTEALRSVLDAIIDGIRPAAVPGQVWVAYR
ncbi:MAG TPA: TetR/AcrR family transcriptional regulator [Streptosporangiaceae bacterium]|jgi:AcrR family transcriptional regulator|nr:TetR/AcrR family transcriptional regulator [Streptosporangiaceae bacterium]